MVLIISVPVLLKLKQPLVRYSIVATGWVLSILVHSSYSTTTASETLLILMKGLVLSILVRISTNYASTELCRTWYASSHIQSNQLHSSMGMVTATLSLLVLRGVLSICVADINCTVSNAHI